MEFEFNHVKIPQGLLDIEDIGNCAIEANTEEDAYFYIILRTSLGVTTVCTFGPVFPDIEHIPTGYSLTLNRQAYKLQSIKKTITSFLNGTRYNKKALCSARVVAPEEATAQIRDLQAYLDNYGEGESENY